MNKLSSLMAVLAGISFSAPVSLSDAAIPEKVLTEKEEKIPSLVTSANVLISLPPSVGDGHMWIPKEVVGGGSYDLIFLLHGSNFKGHDAINLAGEKNGQRNLEEVAEKLIVEGKVRPVILVEPVDRVSPVYTEDFAPKKILTEVESYLAKDYNIHISSVSGIGHSAANCKKDGGIHKLEKEVPLYIMGLSDGTCHRSLHYGEYALMEAKGKPTTIVLHTAGHLESDTGAIYSLLGKNSTTISCSSEYHKACRKHKTAERYVFLTKDLEHNEIMTHSFENILLRYFSVK